MTIEIRFIDETGQERRASPARDVAFFWPQLVTLAAEGLKAETLEPWLREYLEYHKVSVADVHAALLAYYRFCELAVNPDVPTPREALTLSGFTAFPGAAQVVVCAKLGQLVSGAFWAGIRSSTPEGSVPASVRALRDHAQIVAREMVRQSRRRSWWTSWLPRWLTGD